MSGASQHPIRPDAARSGALDTKKAPFGYLDWLRWFSYTVIANIAGGWAL